MAQPGNSNGTGRKINQSSYLQVNNAKWIAPNANRYLNEHENSHLQCKRRQRQAPRVAPLARGCKPGCDLFAGTESPPGKIPGASDRGIGLSGHLAWPKELEWRGYPGAQPAHTGGQACPSRG